MSLICTFGYEGRSIYEFVNLLDRFQVDVVVDVRLKPLSKEYPDFDKFSLVSLLSQRGKRYLHLKELGCPQDIQRIKYQTLGYLKFFQQYERHLQKRRDVIEKLAQETRDLNLCLLCAEADPGICHRTIVADYLQIENFQNPVHHLH